MIIFYSYFKIIPIGFPKADAVLIINPYTVEAFEVSVKAFKMIRGRNP